MKNLMWARLLLAGEGALCDRCGKRIWKFWNVNMKPQRLCAVCKAKKRLRLCIVEKKYNNK